MEPVKLGLKFISGSFSGKKQVIAPSENVAGIVLRTGMFFGGSLSIVSTGTMAPASWSTPGVPVLIMLPGNSAHQLPYPIYLPPGNGLWLSEGNGSIQAFITYDVLPMTTVQDAS